MSNFLRPFSLEEIEGRESAKYFAPKFDTFFATLLKVTGSKISPEFCSGGLQA